MLPPPCWVAADGVKVFGWMPDCGAHYASPIIKMMEKFAAYIEKKPAYTLGSKIKWRHSHVSRCSWGKVVRKNTDQTIEIYKKDTNFKLCSVCRGKGHPWTCQIWNGKPYNGHPSGDEWKNPVKCKNCNGKGYLK
jgi:hypothetical protein